MKPGSTILVGHSFVSPQPKYWGTYPTVRPQAAAVSHRASFLPKL